MSSEKIFNCFNVKMFSGILEAFFYLKNIKVPGTNISICLLYSYIWVCVCDLTSSKKQISIRNKLCKTFIGGNIHEAQRGERQEVGRESLQTTNWPCEVLNCTWDVIITKALYLAKSEKTRHPVLRDKDRVSPIKL